jgi:DNA-binding NarL/FixJ family response regulator
MGNIFEKLGLESRTAAALRAVEILAAPAARV